MSNRRVHGRLASLFAILMALSLVAAACSNKSDGASPSATTTRGTGGTSAPAEGKGFNEPDFSGTPKAGGSISFGTESRVATLDPAGSLAQPSDIVMALAIYDQLITYDAKGKLAPSLATKWVDSDNLQTWTITVRTGTKFQDGTPFNADAVKKQFDRFLDPATKCTCADTVKQITSVTAPNPTTVVFKLNAPNAFWANTLAGSLGFIASPTATAKWGTDYPRHPVGTGPFALPDFDSAILKKNPDYWKKDAKGNQLPYLDQIVVKPIPDARTRLQSLQAGQVDVIQTADTGTIVDVVKSGANFKVQKVNGTSSTIVLFNLKKPPFDDVRIRQAFAYAIDRSQINAVQYQGSRQEAYGPFPPSSPYYTKTNAPHFNLAKAKKLVAQAKAAGVSTKFQALCIPTDESRRILSLVQAQMKKVGLTMDNQFLDQGALVNKIFSKSGDYQASCFRSAQIADADGLYGGLHTDQPGNLTFYSNAKVDKALDDIRATTDPAKQTADLKIVQQQAAKDLPTITLLFDLFGNIYNTKVSGLPVPEPWSLGAIKFTTLYLKQ